MRLILFTPHFCKNESQKYISDEGIQNSCNHWGGAGGREKMSTKSVQNVCIPRMKMDWRHLDSYL